MKILLLFILYLISVIEESTSQVTANSGGGVRIKCKYEEGYETNKKYFCKDEETTCSYQIITEAKHTWVHEDRFSLYDDTNAKVFWVVMRNLTVKDSGTYQCGVDITDKAKEDMHTPVKLKVKAASSKRQSLQDSSHNQAVSHDCMTHVPLSVCDYEETKDTRSHSDTGASTVYSTVGLPTKPSYPSQTV
ncbi:CMRF35-like molecule 8 isoform X3 [Electrophorus electricus]|uniref:CMRF35-like molecule 8 isoform X3 n=1 Tax=Electrophorus electricus TaxID=8005 RepID=UPI0015CFA9B8|nr:CMRF35-like molecule 8 isoform X3 [Electrophorus electricus]